MAKSFFAKRDVYLEIAERYEKYITLGVIKTGERLPSVRVAAGELGVNPNTVQKALQLLEDDGLITTDRTNGKFVANNPNKIKTQKDKIINEETRVFVEKMQAFGLSIKEIKELINNLGE